jgi:hypothetical protein
MAAELLEFTPTEDSAHRSRLRDWEPKGGSLHEEDSNVDESRSSLGKCSAFAPQSRLVAGKVHYDHEERLL